jgi:hypothetical protein
MSARFFRRSFAVLGLPIVFILSALAPAGCDITTYECGQGAICETGAAPGSLCTSYCEHLVDCGDVAPAGEADCRKSCRASAAADSEATEAACQCVIEVSCSDHAECPDLPAPEPSSSSSGAGQGGASSSSSSGGQGAGGSGSCGDAGPCAAGEACVEGACLTPCNASCDCPQGLVCEGGYCGAAEPAPTPCENDCDCPSGGTCTNGTCG